MLDPIDRTPRRVGMSIQRDVERAFDVVVGREKQRMLQRIARLMPHANLRVRANSHADP
jgi:hypothetical protein